MSSPLSRWIVSGLLLLAAPGCKPHLDDTLIVGALYVCLFDSRLECQSLDDDGGWPYGDDIPVNVEFRQVAGAINYLCGISVDGDPDCWGWQDDMNLTEVPEDLDVASFVPGSSNNCVLNSIGELTCWGNIWTGINDPPEGSFDKAAVAESLGCAWSSDEGWACWGDGVDYYFAGAGQEPPSEEPASLVSGTVNICMLNTDGVISCWGYEGFGVNDPPGGGGWYDLSVGRGHACAFRDGVPKCWGADVEDSPWRSDPEGDWIAYTAGNEADCGIRSDGEVVCWGCFWKDPFACDWDD